MRQTGFFHHIGSFLLLVATILLIVTCISAPVVRDISLLKVVLNNGNSLHPAISFGTFGYCAQNTMASGDYCSPSAVGYRPADILAENNADFEVSQYAADTANALTKVMVLHPVAAGITFIAFLLALGAGVVGSFLASLVALLAFLITLVVLVTDFVSLSLLRNAVNSAGNGVRAEFGAAAWTLLASAVCNLIAAVIVFFTCCSARLHRRRSASSHHGAKVDRYDSPPMHHTASTRRRGWF